MKPSVFVVDPISEKAMALLSANADIVRWDDPGIRNWPETADAVIVRTSPIRGDDIKRSRRLRVIGKHGVGIDNIAVDAAAARGIAVVRTPGANAQSVAELVLGLALAAARNIAAFDARLRSGGWSNNKGLASESLGRELAGCTLGILGAGATGQATAALFRDAFAAQILTYRRGDGRAALERLLSASDVVSIHLPYNAETRHLIGAAELALTQPGSILINTARGGIVDEAALFAALKGGRPAAAGFDVFVDEPPPANHPLLSLPNFVATPHIGAATAQALDKVGIAVVDKVLAALRTDR